MRRVDVHDVVVARHRPVGTVEAVPAVMHRRLVAQAPEPLPVAVSLEQERVGDVDVFDRDCVGVDVDLGRVVGGFGRVHGARSLL